jgi:hypothetical protein
MYLTEMTFRSVSFQSPFATLNVLTFRTMTSIQLNLSVRKEMRCESVDCIHLSRDKSSMLGLLRTFGLHKMLGMNKRFSRGIFQFSWSLSVFLDLVALNRMRSGFDRISLDNDCSKVFMDYKRTLVTVLHSPSHNADITTDAILFLM